MYRVRAVRSRGRRRDQVSVDRGEPQVVARTPVRPFASHVGAGPVHVRAVPGPRWHMEVCFRGINGHVATSLAWPGLTPSGPRSKHRGSQRAVLTLLLAPLRGERIQCYKLPTAEAGRRGKMSISDLWPAADLRKRFRSSARQSLTHRCWYRGCSGIRTAFERGQCSDARLPRQSRMNNL